MSAKSEQFRFVQTDVSGCESGVIAPRAPVVGSDRPRPQDDVTAHPLDDELVVYAARSGQTYLLNVTGAALWPLLDGSNSVDSLAAALAERYALDTAQALTDTIELLESLRRADLIAID